MTAVLIRRLATLVVLTALYPAVASASEPKDPNAGKIGGLAEATHGNSFLKNLSAYKPAYFLIGPSPFDAKFQISFKYRLFGRGGKDQTSGFSLHNFFFAYTQTSLWDLHAPSAPFTDTSFRPEFFYRTHLTTLAFHNADVALQFGAFHESNGKGGADSRSYNAIYVKPGVAVPFDDGNLILTVAAQFWQYVGSRSDNPDIADYRGHASLLTSFGDPHGLMVTTQLRGSFSSGKGNLRADASYPLKEFLGLGLYAYAQVYHGYAEDLLGYNKKDTRFRVGVALTR